VEVGDKCGKSTVTTRLSVVLYCRYYGNVDVDFAEGAGRGNIYQAESYQPAIENSSIVGALYVEGQPTLFDEVNMKRPIGSDKMRKAHAFLVQVETDDSIFTCEELRQASGWAISHTKGIIGKKLISRLRRVDSGYKIDGIKAMSLDAFCCLCSQTAALASDPDRPRLDPKVEGLVNKAQEAALAAVQHYNNPTSKFRSANFIVLMVIAFTALFHAVFEQQGVDYIEKKEDTTPKTTPRSADENHLFGGTRRVV
jgi:hypothetical protein